MNTAPPSVSAASVRTSRILRRKVFRIESSVGRDGPWIDWMKRSKRLRPKPSARPPFAIASRTVIRTPRQTGHAAAAIGTTRPIAISSARTLAGRKNSVASKLTSPAVNRVSAHAPSAPNGSATSRARSAYAEDDAEVDPGDLAVPRADRLHHPDLARLLGEDRADRVDHEEPGHEEAQPADRAEDQEHRVEHVLRRVLAGRRDLDERDGRPGPLEAVLDLVRDGAVLRARRVVEVGPDAELVERVVEAEVPERVEGDVGERPARRRTRAPRRARGRCRPSAASSSCPGRAGS